jgi:HD domain
VTDNTRHDAIWNLPDTEIARAARQLVFDVAPAVIANHSLRSYLYAREAAAANDLRSGVDYDDELVFLSCILHDLGITDYGNGDHRFEVDGADAAARFLRERGMSEPRVTTVWQSIALHTSLGLADKFGANQAVTQRGISIDVDGIEKHLLPTGFADRVHTAWPRYDLGYAMSSVIAGYIRANPQKGPPFTFPGHLRQLFDETAPSITFFDIVRNSGWNDQPSPVDSTHG